MLSFKKSAVVTALLLIMAVLMVGCNAGKETAQPVTDNKKNDKLIVFVSILPQADFVRQLGGDQVEVSVMMPPGANEHNYEPDTGQLKALSQADLYIKVGHLPFEDAWMKRFISTNRDMLVVDSSQSIETIDHNPHIWLSPRLVKIQAETISTALIQLDSENQDYYLQRKQVFLKELDKLDREITATLSGVKDKSFLVYHPAWGYFARDYGLQEVAIEEHGKEPGAREMSRVINYAKKNQIKTVFDSSQHSTHSADAIAAELGARVVLLDPLPADYMDNMRKVAETMATELSRE
ncbi:MAG TPA: zinc ABC transporter substrate-binding protein [Syntrophomonas sp.]|jgi:zinc transport system substrate-binding protein|nr:zinc ABC transporter substrate-binding protein [Syntrophomonas sp.]